MYFSCMSQSVGYTQEPAEALYSPKPSPYTCDSFVFYNCTDTMGLIGKQRGRVMIFNLFYIQIYIQENIGSACAQSIEM